MQRAIQLHVQRQTCCLLSSVVVPSCFFDGFSTYLPNSWLQYLSRLNNLIKFYDLSSHQWPSFNPNRWSFELKKFQFVEIRVLRSRILLNKKPSTLAFQIYIAMAPEVVLIWLVLRTFSDFEKSALGLGIHNRVHIKSANIPSFKFVDISYRTRLTFSFQSRCCREHWFLNFLSMAIRNACESKQKCISN